MLPYHPCDMLCRFMCMCRSMCIVDTGILYVCTTAVCRYTSYMFGSAFLYVCMCILRMYQVFHSVCAYQCLSRISANRGSCLAVVGVAPLAQSFRRVNSARAPVPVASPKTRPGEARQGKARQAPQQNISNPPLESKGGERAADGSRYRSALSDLGNVFFCSR